MNTKKLIKIIDKMPKPHNIFLDNECHHVFKVEENDYRKYICIKCSLVKKRDDIK